VTIMAADPITMIFGTATMTVTCPAITITTPSPLPNGVAGVKYSQQLVSNGAAPVMWTLLGDEGDLPANLSFSASGVLSGTPVPFEFQMKTFTVRATSACGSTTTKSFTITINAPH